MSEGSVGVIVKVMIHDTSVTNVNTSLAFLNSSPFLPSCYVMLTLSLSIYIYIYSFLGEYGAIDIHGYYFCKS